MRRPLNNYAFKYLFRTVAFFLQFLPGPALIPTERLGWGGAERKGTTKGSGHTQDKKSPSSSGSSQVTTVVLGFIP